MYKLIILSLFICPIIGCTGIKEYKLEKQLIANEQLLFADLTSFADMDTSILVDMFKRDLNVTQLHKISEFIRKGLIAYTKDCNISEDYLAEERIFVTSNASFNRLVLLIQLRLLISDIKECLRTKTFPSKFLIRPIPINQNVVRESNVTLHVMISSFFEESLHRTPFVVVTNDSENFEFTRDTVYFSYISNTFPIEFVAKKEGTYRVNANAYIFDNISNEWRRHMFYTTYWVRKD